MSLSNPKSKSSVANPMITINGYLWDTFKAIDPGLASLYTINGVEIMPIFPITDTHAGDMIWNDKAYFIYNSLKNRPTDPFYPVKMDTIHYGLKGDAVQTFEWTQALHVVLDRMDDAAKDINEWNSNLLLSEDDSLVNKHQHVYFHYLRVYQMEKPSGRDYVNDQNIITDIFVRVQYHYTESLKDIITVL